jgi:hypothetical protein
VGLGPQWRPRLCCGSVCGADRGGRARYGLAGAPGGWGSRACGPRARVAGQPKAVGRGLPLQIASGVAPEPQALAVLFYRSGWTQEELATKERKSRSYLARMLLFGRFLIFVPMGTNPESLPNNRTEQRFRAFWERTESGPNERDRPHGSVAANHHG